MVEIDRRLEQPLREALAPFDNVTLHIADALELDLAGLRPAPTKVVANLPYAIAATVILRTIEELPSVAELGRDGPARGRRAARRRARKLRLRGAVGAGAARVRGAGAAPGGADVFRPVPNVDSVLVGLRRRGPGADRARALGWSSRRFAHRRKALAGSLALAPGAPRDSRSRARRRWWRSGMPPTSAPSGCRPSSFGELATRWLE